MSKDAMNLWDRIGLLIEQAKKDVRPRREFVGSEQGGRVTLGSGMELVPKLFGPPLAQGQEVLTMFLDDKRRIVLGPVQVGQSQDAIGSSFTSFFPITHNVLAEGGPYTAYLGPSTSHPLLGGVGTGQPVHDTGVRAGAPGSKWAYCWIQGLNWGWVPETALTGLEPAAPIVNAGADGSVDVNVNWTQAGSFSDATGTSWSATVDYGDGAGAVPLTLSGKNFTLSHTWTSAGTKTVTVAVTDNTGLTGTDTVSVTVNAAPVWTHKVTGSTLNLRQSIGGTLIAAMPVGSRLRPVSGPTASGGYNWWYVETENWGYGYCVDGFDPI